MSTQFILVNETKKEQITFIHLNGSKMRELVGNPAQSAIVTWYLLQNQGDHIQFISDSSNHWPFSTGSYEDALSYIDKTDDLLQILIQNGLLKDNGMLFVDNDDPQNVYIRDITKS